MGLPISLPVLLLSFALCYAGVDLAFRHIGRRAQRQTYAVTIRMGDREISLTALADSGNELIDPVSGCAALIISAETAAALFRTPEYLMLDVSEALERMNREYPRARWRLLPCTCVAEKRTLLLCFRPDSIHVDGRRRKDLLTAVSRSSLSPDGAYQAIL